MTEMTRESKVEALLLKRFVGIQIAETPLYDCLLAP
jgi:hypothetical protein